MKRTIERRDIYIVLGIILGVAFVLRLWGIWFGLPFSYRADEYHEVFRALELGTGNFNFERTTKGGYFYVLFVEYGMLFVALKLAGVVESAQDFARYFVADPTAFYLIGRTTTALIGTVNVLLVYKLGGRAYGLGAGLVAAAILAVDFLNAEHSHFITVDVPLACLITASLLFAVRMVTDGKGVDYKWAALFAALATTTKLPGILLVVPLFVAHCYFVRQREGAAREFLLSRNLWWAVGIFITVLAITNPGLFINPPLGAFGIVDDLGAIGEDAADEMPIVSPPNLFVYYFQVISDSLGWPLMVVSVVGFIYALWKHTATDTILISFAVVFYWVFASTESHLYFPRYMLPFIVVQALLAGRIVATMWPGSNYAKQGVAVSLLLILIAIPAHRTAANNYLLTQTDTRTLANKWFEENVPQGSKVMIEGVKIEPSRLTVPLRDTPDNMRANIEYYKSREPGKAIYLRYLLQIDLGRTYDLELVRRPDLQSLGYYKERGVQYLVIRPQAFAHSRRMGSTGRDFIDELQDDPDVRLLKSFKSDARSRPGPDIDVYEVRTNAETSAL